MVRDTQACGGWAVPFMCATCSQRQHCVLQDASVSLINPKKFFGVKGFGFTKANELVSDAIVVRLVNIPFLCADTQPMRRQSSSGDYFDVHPSRCAVRGPRGAARLCCGAHRRVPHGQGPPGAAGPGDR